MNAAPDTTGVARSDLAPVRRVTLAIDPRACRALHHVLAERIARECGASVDVAQGRMPEALPAAVTLLATLERMLDRDAGERLGDSLDFDRLPLAPHAGTEVSDVIVDFCGESDARAHLTLRVLYDGVPGDAVLLAALLAGRTPTIELQDTRTGAIMAQAAPATDNAATLRAALDCVLARLVTLVLATLRGWTLRGATPFGHGRAQARDIAVSQAKALAHAAARRLYRMCCHAPHWRVCWRHVENDGGVWGTHALAGAPWSIIPDPGFRFYADPFPFSHRGQTCIFVEDLDHRTGKGIISVLPFGIDGRPGPARPVLEEPWHLSYPFVFEEAGQIWMIPESSADRSVRLYRADPFPDRWVAEGILLRGIEASDATVVRHGDRLWMFAATRDGAGSWSDTLSLFSAADVRGPWTPHPANPVVIDRRTARPAGAFVKRDGRLWRPVQDCTAGYGTGVGLVEVLQLAPDAYAQRLQTMLHAEANWPGRRFHTLNQAGGIECIDGAAHSPRSRLLAGALEDWSGRRQRA
jgi:hypothetical protein